MAQAKAGSQTPAAKQDRLSRVSIESAGITLRLANHPDLGAFAAEVNSRAHLDGLDDSINPDTLDAGKLQAFVDALQTQPPSLLAALFGHVLLLGGLGVRNVETTAPGNFGPNYHLVVRDKQGNAILCKANLTIDATLAHKRIDEAQRTIGALAKGEAQARVETGQLRSRASQAAFDTASFWHKAQPDSVEAAQEFARTKKQRELYGLPYSLKGMPPG